ERGAVRDLLPELVGARPQRRVREPFQLLLQRVDLRHPRHEGLDPPLVRRAKQLAGNGADHAGNPLVLCCRAATRNAPSGNPTAVRPVDVYLGEAPRTTSGSGRKCGTFLTSSTRNISARRADRRVCREIGGGRTLVNQTLTCSIPLTFSSKSASK